MGGRFGSSKRLPLFQIVTIRLSYKLQWPELRMNVNESADWGKENEINISPDNIEVGDMWKWKLT